MVSFVAAGSLENFLFPGGAIPLHNVLVWAHTTGYRDWELSTILSMPWAKRHLPLNTTDDAAWFVGEHSFVDALLKFPNSKCFQSYLDNEPGRLPGYSSSNIFSKKSDMIRASLKQPIHRKGLTTEETTPDEIDNDDALFGEGLGLDSLDAVELVVVVKKHFNVEIKDMTEGREAFASINSLAKYIEERTQ